ncbi:MAG: hypothetical protein K6A63_02720 [Acholeplasmatales bacterium]|nr:hypothetical protein [Acholeplasmatales bacterium]
MKILKKISIASFLGLSCATCMLINNVYAEDIPVPGAKFDSNVWEHKLSDHYDKESSYGGVRTNYSIYKLSDNYNNNDSNYYLVDQQSFQSLDEKHNKVKKKFFGGIKFMWLNIGVSHSCDVNSINISQELYDYSPKVNLEVKSYTSSVGGELGASISSKDGVGATGSANFSRSVTYSTDGRKVVSNSRTYDNYFEVDFIYDCFKVKQSNFWDYTWRIYIGGVIPGILWANDVNGEISHKSNYSSFMGEMSEYSSFLLKTSKSNSRVSLNLKTTSNQLYIDYDYKNSHKFDSYTAEKLIVLNN